MDLAMYLKGGVDGTHAVKALLLYYKQTKTKSEGSICGLVRHKDVNLCAISALAFYLFYRLVMKVGAIDVTIL